jgi:hypothetical protein
LHHPEAKPDAVTDTAAETIADADCAKAAGHTYA